MSNYTREVVAKGVEVKVNPEKTEVIDIVRNEHGNLELIGIGSVTYEMLNEELWFYQED